MIVTKCTIVMYHHVQYLGLKETYFSCDYFCMLPTPCIFL